MSELPWGALLASAARMGIRPADFWEMSVKEWRMMMAGMGAAPAMGRTELETLLAKYPDGGRDG